MAANTPAKAATAPNDAFVSPSAKGARGLRVPPSPLAIMSMRNSTSGDNRSTPN